MISYSSVRVLFPRRYVTLSPDPPGTGTGRPSMVAALFAAVCAASCPIVCTDSETICLTCSEIDSETACLRTHKKDRVTEDGIFEQSLCQKLICHHQLSLEESEPTP